MTIRAMNHRLTRLVITRLGTRVVAGRMASIVPFGVGAIAGGGVNFVLARDLARRANETFERLSPVMGNSRVVTLRPSLPA
jgi:uncharacterized membrane protein (DUF485 family)